MDLETYAKEYINLQRRSCTNLFDALTLAQDCAERTSNYWICHLGSNRSVQATVERWYSSLGQKRDASRKLIEDNSFNVEDYFSVVDP